MSNESLHLSHKGAALIMAFENCLAPTGDGRFKTYICPAGVLTIGWGHTNDHGRSFRAGDVWTKSQCNTAFAEDMAGFEIAVKRLVKVGLKQDQFDALLSFSYNCGDGNLSTSTLLRKVNVGDFAGAAREFARWNRGGGKVLAGLTRRRASEALLFQGIPDNNYDGKPDAIFAQAPMAQAVDAPQPEKPLYQSKIVQAATTIGIGTGGDAISTVSDTASQVALLKSNAEQAGFFDIVQRLMQNPRFLLALVLIIAVGLIIYWRWRDHQ